MLGQAGHMQKGGPSRQGLLRKLHHPKRLRTGQPERSGGSAVINGNFNIGEELGRILHLVNEHRQIVHLQKEGGICLGQLALLHIIQRHIISLRGDISRRSTVVFPTWRGPVIRIQAYS